MNANFIIGLMFLFASPICYALNSRKYIQLDMTTKTRYFVSPELQIDSAFVESLYTVLLDKNDRHVNNILSNPREKAWRHFHIHFEEKDSLDYHLVISLLDIPARKSIGFFVYNGFYFWFGENTPPNIILKVKSKKRFSYKEPLPGPYDPPFWFLRYNMETGIIEVKEDVVVP